MEAGRRHQDTNEFEEPDANTFDHVVHSDDGLASCIIPAKHKDCVNVKVRIARIPFLCL